MSEEDAISEVEQDIGKIQGGYIGEQSAVQKLTGNLRGIKDRFRARRGSNTGSDSGSESNT